MKRKNKHFSFLQIVAFAFVMILTSCVITPLTEIATLEDGFYADYSDIETLNNSGRFGFVRASLDQKTQNVDGQKKEQNEVVFKLFGLIPVKRVQVVMNDEQEFYVGGVPIGLNINSSGAIVVGAHMGAVRRHCQTMAL